MMDEYEDSEGVSTEDLIQCNTCKRWFFPKVLEKHVKICQKSSSKKRKVFDSSRQRAEGTDIPILKPIKPKAEPPKKPSTWRQKHEDFIATVRAAKAMTKILKEGGPLPPPPPPTYDPDYIQCPYCQRRFNENAADRHIKFCQEQAARMPSKGKPGDVKKPAARTQYKPPPLVKKATSPGVSSSPSSSSRLPQRSGTMPTGGTSSAKIPSSAPTRGGPSNFVSQSQSVGNKSRVTSSGYGPKITSPGSGSIKKSNEIDGGNEAANGKTKSKFCHSCGTKYPVESANFCGECGVKRMCI